MTDPHYSPSYEHIAALARMPGDPMSRVKAINDYIEDCEMRSRLVRRRLTHAAVSPFKARYIVSGVVIGLMVSALVWSYL